VLWIAAAKEFGDDKQIGDTKVIAPFIENPPDEDVRMQLVKQTAARSPLVFYFEGKIVTSTDNSAWRIEPGRLYFPSFLSQPPFWQNSTHRDVQLVVEWSQPGKEATPFSTMKLDFVGVTASDVTLSHLGRNPLLWMAVPSASAPKKAMDFFPVNLKVQLIETTHPYMLAKYLGNALKAQKEAIAKEATDTLTLAISAQARNTAQLGLLDIADKAYSAYTTAYDAVASAVNDYSKATDPAAQSRAKNAYVKAVATLKQRETAGAAAYKDAGLPFEALQVPRLP
jgi:hypothetical protein